MTPRGRHLAARLQAEKPLAVAGLQNLRKKKKTRRADGERAYW